MDHDHQAQHYVRRLETLHQAVQAVATHHPDTAAAAGLRATLDAEIAILQVQSAERVAEAAQKSSDSLVRATWVLAWLTVVLAMASVALLIVTVAVSG